MPLDLQKKMDVACQGIRTKEGITGDIDNHGMFCFCIHFKAFAIEGVGYGPWAADLGAKQRAATDGMGAQLGLCQWDNIQWFSHLKMF